VPTRVVVQAAMVSGIQPMLRLMSGAGGPAISGATAHWAYSTARLDLTLAPGTYFVEVSDLYDDAAGSYAFTYERVQALTTDGSGAAIVSSVHGEWTRADR
jgi:hypothetical protein